MRFNIEQSLKVYFPNLYRLITQSNKEIGWSSINSSLIKYVENNNELDSKPSNIFSLIIEKKFGIGEGNAMLDFYEELFLSLDKVLNDKEKKLIYKNLINILTQKNNDYLNFIGELSVLNNIKRSDRYVLMNCEEPILDKKGKSTDFKLFDKYNNIEILLEIMNLHFELNEFESEEKFKYHIKSKLEKKIRSKIITEEKNIYIQPVFWTKSLEQLKTLEKIYSNRELVLEYTLIPLTYCSWKIDNKYIHRFEAVNSILRD